MRTTPQGCVNNVAVFFHVGLYFIAQHLPGGGQAFLGELQEKMTSSVSGTLVYWEGAYLLCWKLLCS